MATVGQSVGQWTRSSSATELEFELEYNFDLMIYLKYNNNLNE